MAESLINWNKIKSDEGFRNELYILDDPNTEVVEFAKSGITMLGGIDLGQGTYPELSDAIDNLGLTEEKDKAKISGVKAILKKLSGKKGQAATDAYQALSKDNKATISEFFAGHGESIQDNFNTAKETQVINAYNALAKEHGGTEFEDLDEGWRTVIASAYFQYGSKQSLLKQVAKGNKDAALKNLNKWDDTTGGKGSVQATAIDNRYKAYGAELEDTELVINSYAPGTYKHAFKRAELQGKETFEWTNPDTKKRGLYKVEYEEPEQTGSLNNDQMFDTINQGFDFDNIPYEDEGDITYG